MTRRIGVCKDLHLGSVRNRDHRQVVIALIELEIPIRRDDGVEPGCGIVSLRHETIFLFEVVPCIQGNYP